MIKKASIAAVLVAFLFIFTGCSSEEDEIETYSSSTFSSAPVGWYIMHSDGTFEPLLNVSIKSNLMNGYAKGTQTPLRLLADTYIPTCGSGDSIVVKSSSIPDRLTAIYPFSNLGYTMGVTFARRTTAGQYTFTTSDALTAGSSAESVFAKADATKTVISSVGNMTISPDILNDANSMTNLAKDAIYEVVWYQGTVKKTSQIVADCIQFIQDTSTVEAFADVKYTDHGYAVMMFTDTIADGYYYIDEGGFFQLDRSNADQAENSEENTETDNNTDENAEEGTSNTEDGSSDASTEETAENTEETSDSTETNE